MNQIDKIETELKRRIEVNRINKANGYPECDGAIIECQGMLDFIKSLSHKTENGDKLDAYYGTCDKEPPTEAIATNIKQSMRLIELGLDPTSADMTYKQVAHNPSGKFEFELEVGLDVAIKNNLFSYRNGYVIPAWSLPALLKLMPTGYLIGMTGGGYFYCVHPSGFLAKVYKKPITAAYNLMEWSLENNKTQKI